MKRRSTRKSSAAKFLVSPQGTTTPPNESPKKQFEFNFSSFNTTPPSLKNNKKLSDINTKSNKKPLAAVTTSVLMQPTEKLSSSVTKPLSTISDLKNLASSRFESIKRHLDCSDSEILKDIEASQSRHHKRLKIQSQASQQMMDEIEKEYKKITGQISESREAIKVSFMQLIVQTSASRLCKSIPERSESFEKAIDVLRSRYGVTST